MKLFASFKQKTEELSEDMPTYPGIQLVILKEKGNLSFFHLMKIANMNAKTNIESYLDILVIHSILVVIFVYLMIQISILNLILILAIIIPL